MRRADLNGDGMEAGREAGTEAGAEAEAETEAGAEAEAEAEEEFLSAAEEVEEVEEVAEDVEVERVEEVEDEMDEAELEAAARRLAVYRVPEGFGERREEPERRTMWLVRCFGRWLGVRVRERRGQRGRGGSEDVGLEELQRARQEILAP